MVINTDSHLFVVSVDPKPKKRPKVYRYNTINPSYDDELVLRKAVANLYNCPLKPFSGMISISLKFYKRIPKSTPKWKLEFMENGVIRPIVLPDLDNYIKLVLDALNGLIWDDDRIIVDITASKYYSKSPRIELQVTQHNIITKKSDLKNS